MKASPPHCRPTYCNYTFFRILLDLFRQIKWPVCSRVNGPTCRFRTFRRPSQLSYFTCTGERPAVPRDHFVQVRANLAFAPPRFGGCPHVVFGFGVKATSWATHFRSLKVAKLRASNPDAKVPQILDEARFADSVRHRPFGNPGAWWHFDGGFDLRSKPGWCQCRGKRKENLGDDSAGFSPKHFSIRASPPSRS